MSCYFPLLFKHNTVGLGINHKIRPMTSHPQPSPQHLHRSLTQNPPPLHHTNPTQHITHKTLAQPLYPHRSQILAYSPLSSGLSPSHHHAIASYCRHYSTPSYTSVMQCKPLFHLSPTCILVTYVCTYLSYPAIQDMSHFPSSCPRPHIHNIHMECRI